MMRDTLLEKGVEADRISVIESEEAAINTALASAQAGDLLVIFADELARSWKQIIYFKKDERAAVAPVKPARADTPAPEFEDLMSASDQLIRDARGVRLARVEPEEAD